MQISIESEVKKAVKELKSIQVDLLPKAARGAINKTVEKARIQTTNFFFKQYALKRGDIYKAKKPTSPVRQVKSTGTNIALLKGEVRVSNKSLPLIKFVKGNKSEPTAKKGVPVRKRKPVRVEVYRGRRRTSKRLFIAKGKGGSYQVFNRQRKTGAPTFQSAISLGKNYDRRLRTKIEALGVRRMALEFKRQLNVLKLKQSRKHWDIS